MAANTATARPRRPPGPAVRRRRRRRGRLWAGVAAVVVAAGVGVGALILKGSGPAAHPDGCTVAGVGTASYALTLEQAQNAAIVAAVAFRQGLPDHAVTIALATALQETHLYNLAYGDLDSVGLFQQRPSQGWGTKAQLLDPNYATTAFYSHLVQIPGWTTMAVTVAAQTVQRSAAPDAYAAWEDEARALAVALTGEHPQGMACYFGSYSGAAPTAAALTTAATTELGSAPFGVAVPTKAGWQVALWAEAHAWAYHLSSVTYAGSVWTPRSGVWKPARAGATGVGVGLTYAGASSR